MTVCLSVDEIKCSYIPHSRYSIFAAVFLYKASLSYLKCNFISNVSSQALPFGVINQREETEVQQIISQTVDRLQRASAGRGDIGSRYARLLELLWKPKMTLPTAIPEPQPAGPSVNRIQEPYNMQPSPRGNFSWLDLGAVGDFVC